MTDKGDMKKTLSLFPVVGLLLACNAFAQKNPFQDKDYKAKSKVSLSAAERTVNYTYPKNPCGTLMTEFTGSGSVQLGRGPVYELMLEKCQAEDSNSYPDDGTVRTYACRNVASEASVLGQATFAFQCAKGAGEPQVVKAPLNRIPQKLH